MRTIILAAALSFYAGALAADPGTKAPEAGAAASPREAYLSKQYFANEKGDAATVWVSPVLYNHDSRMSNIPYAVDGKSLHATFGFSVGNLDQGNALDVTLRCFTLDGVADTKYSATLTAPARGAAIWNTSAIAPTRTTDSVTADIDAVWCRLTAQRPFVAFGTRSNVRGAVFGESDVALTAIARY